MKVKRNLLAEIDRCYTVAPVIIDESVSIIYGSDGQNSAGIRFYGDNFEKSEYLWENIGGCMSIKQLPNKQNELLVLQEFYLGESPSKAKVVWYKYKNGQWESKDLIHLPFTHRMDVFTYHNRTYVLLATVSDFKKNKEDWNIPGSVYAFELKTSFESHSVVSAQKVLGDVHYNHGYYRNENDIYIAGKEGIFHLKLEDTDMINWKFTNIYPHSSSDLIVQDIDQDGLLEIVTINEFHGNEFSVLKMEEGVYREIFSYSEGCEIIHGLSNINYKNRPCVVVGVRKGKGQLLLLSYSENEYKVSVVDEGLGPINVATVIKDNHEMIAVANHTTHTAMIYEIS